MAQRGDLKKQFINYLRMSYGADPGVTESGLPPLRPAFNFPAFRKENEGLGALGGLPQPGMGGGMGMGRPGMGGPGMGMQPMGGLGMGGGLRQGVQQRPQGGMGEAQRLLLGR